MWCFVYLEQQNCQFQSAQVKHAAHHVSLALETTASEPGGLSSLTAPVKHVHNFQPVICLRKHPDQPEVVIMKAARVRVIPRLSSHQACLCEPLQKKKHPANFRL